MLKNGEKRILSQEQLNKEESASAGAAAEISGIRKRVRLQAGLAVLTVVLTGVLIFAMTAAWYTNVVQTSGLIFQVEQWGVDVGATISTVNIQAAPGDSGIISFQANNTGSDIVNVAVSVTKNAMDEIMQRRLYFYVDAQKTTNQETVQRVYLTANTAYDYLLFANGDLTISETYYNDAPLKWSWVYDVLGYYVQAAVAEDGTITVAEYLRPVEYDYDEATFDADGNLATVDGTKTALEFLIELSKNDGYAGALTETTAPINGYYPISVDENGSGVYVCLLTYAQIQAEMKIDTELGASAGTENAQTYVANFTIYAENFETEAVAVNTVDALTAALSNGATPLVQLTEDLTLSEAVTLSANTDTILDLNGHTLTTSVSTPAITAPEGSSLTVTNGTMTGSEGSGNGFAITGAEVTLNQVTMSGYPIGVRVTDFSGSGQDSVIKMTDCDISASTCAVLLQGNGSLSEQTAKLIIDGCTLYSDGITISGNGTITGAGRWGTDIQVINSTILSTEEEMTCAIYQPQPYGILNIVSSTVKGHTAVVIKGGDVVVTGSEIIGTGPEGLLDEPAYLNGGFTNTGDGIYIEDGYQYRISIKVDGTSTLTSYYAKGLRIFAADSPYVTAVVDSGTAIHDETPPTE